ncbi:MAG: DUF87 domain-containing protein [Pseudomonadota bacterium]|nr:DUF87 domain-containing protein [Pseudomonadota bacterium]
MRAWFCRWALAWWLNGCEVAGMLKKTRPQHGLVLGRTGSGKSELVKTALRAGRLGNRLLVIDTEDEYDAAGVPELVPEISIDQAVVVAREGAQTFAWRFVVDPDSPDIDDVFRLAMAVRDCTVLAEEVADYKHALWYRRALVRGRKRGVRVLSMSQRPYEVNRTVSSQSAFVVAFYSDEPRDLEYVKHRFGAAAEAELRTLDPARYVCCVWGEMDLFYELLHPRNGNRCSETVGPTPTHPKGETP